MIQMVAGVYGLPVPNGSDADGNPKYRIKGMGPNDGPFSIAPEKEERLVKLGIARYVGDIPTDHADEEDSVDDAPIGFDEMPPDDFTDGEAEEEAEPKPLEELNRDELRAICQEYGLPYKANDSKAVLIAKISEYQNAAVEAEDDDAPVFDASEAVL